MPNTILMVLPDSSVFVEKAWSNATSILEKEGKVQGKSVEPYSVSDF